ncbi:MAG: saccharopine dehydrogenase NADP-binding domain-containing protein, partial [Muribaculaceae bacterium]|nr:saccharopine dehydrogenase NADP-binding domain-containing protein [Muribaculaceae bacterium]
MAKVVIIGVGGVGTVAAHKCAQNPEVFTEIVLASRRREKCDAVKEAILSEAAKHGRKAPVIETDRVDADNVDEVVALLRRHNPELVI